MADANQGEARQIQQRTETNGRSNGHDHHHASTDPASVAKHGYVQDDLCRPGSSSAAAAGVKGANASGNSSANASSSGSGHTTRSGNRSSGGKSSRPGSRGGTGKSGTKQPVKIGQYTMLQTLGTGSFGKVKRESQSRGA